MINKLIYLIFGFTFFLSPHDIIDIKCRVLDLSPVKFWFWNHRFRSKFLLNICNFLHIGILMILSIVLFLRCNNLCHFILEILEVLVFTLVWRGLTNLTFVMIFNLSNLVITIRGRIQSIHHITIVDFCFVLF